MLLPNLKPCTLEQLPQTGNEEARVLALEREVEAKVRCSQHLLLALVLLLLLVQCLHSEDQQIQWSHEHSHFLSTWCFCGMSITIPCLQHFKNYAYIDHKYLCARRTCAQLFFMS